jgi:hypothetical protein
MAGSEFRSIMPPRRIGQGPNIGVSGDDRMPADPARDFPI